MQPEQKLVPILVQLGKSFRQIHGRLEPIVESDHHGIFQIERFVSLTLHLICHLAQSAQTSQHFRIGKYQFLLCLLFAVNLLFGKNKLIHLVIEFADGG